MASQTLDVDESRRYARQTLLPQVGLKGQLGLKSKAVLVVGVGGLGCPVAQYLCALGVGRLGLIDGDLVDESNLHRQILYGPGDVGKNKALQAAKRLGGQNPHVIVNAHAVELSYANVETVFEGYDLIVDGSDNFHCRYLVNDACVLLGLPFISAAVQQFEGQVSLYNHADGPCYRCLFPVPPPPGQVQNCAEAGVLGVVPGLMGLIQASEAAKVLLGLGGLLSGRLLIVDALNMAFSEVGLPKDPDCLACGREPRVTDLSASQRMVDEQTSHCEASPQLLQISPAKRV
jgi:molybdopterin/thiamine biosynthesis adenylyltransferase